MESEIALRKAVLIAHGHKSESALMTIWFYMLFVSDSLKHHIGPPYRHEMQQVAQNLQPPHSVGMKNLSSLAEARKGVTVRPILQLTAIEKGDTWSSCGTIHGSRKPLKMQDCSSLLSDGFTGESLSENKKRLYNLLRS